MIVRSRAPLRIGLAGGGTDLAVYSETYGGQVLNAAIGKYAYATICPRRDGRIVLHATDRGERIELEATPYLDVDGGLDLLKGVYNRVVRDFNHSAPLSFELTTHVDAPAGSGLGSSSTLVVAVLGAFVEWLKLPLSEYDIAKLATDIERNDLGQAGGRQDQYAATFGGWNFIEFLPDDNVVVNPLRIKPSYLRELQFNLLLYYTGTSRLSSRIIEGQVKNVGGKTGNSVEAMHQLKQQAAQMKEAVLKGDLDHIGQILNYGWEFKKQTASGISNEMIEEVYRTAVRAGATGGKMSGAGGGGFMMLFCPGNTRFAVIDALSPFGGEVHDMRFESEGLVTWHVR